MDGGPTQRWEAQTASGASTSSYIDLGNRYCKQMAVRYVTMSTGALVTVYGADATTIESAASATFYPVQVQEPGTAAAAYNNLTLASGVSGGWGMFPGTPHRFIQFITSAVVSGGVSFTVIGND